MNGSIRQRSAGSWERIVLPAIAGVALIAVAVALEAIKYTSDMAPVE